jgi:uncharacterized phage-like protein YoqJ
MTCCFFGHKDTPADISQKLEQAVEKLIVESGIVEFLLGNQGNFDMMALRVLRKMKEKYPYISYNIVLAYVPTEQEGWHLFDYRETMLPEGIEHIHPRYAISWRNKWMVNKADVVVAYVVYSWGGAAKFVDIAYQKRKIVLNLAKQ